MARVLIVLALAAAPAVAQPVALQEVARPGELSRVAVTLAVEGKLLVSRAGRPDAIPLTAQATVQYTQRADAPGHVSRFYSEARSATDTGLERAVRQLGPDRRGIVVTRTPAGVMMAFSPAGPLTREELELVGEHFDADALPALLPPTPVALNATWPVPPDAARRALHFDGVIKSELVGTLTGLTDDAATVTISGTAQGLELGAEAEVKVTATLTFDRKLARVVKLDWTQIDHRKQGPASPATELTAKIGLTRTLLNEAPAGLAAIAPNAEPSGAGAMLRYVDPRGRYEFVAPREWHVVGRTADHLTLRLIENGEFVAQATVTAWKSAQAGSHTPAAEFQALLGKLPGWVPGTIEAAGEVPTDAGRWLYRVAATGTQDGVAVAQTFYLLAGPKGQQVAVTVLCRPLARAKLGVRDAQLVNGVEFPARN